jgi:AraC-like DNA-binding protein
MLIDEHQSELGGWRTASRRASPALRPFVRDLFGSQSKLPQALHERHIPALSVALIINFGARHHLIERASPNGKTGLNAWVTGLQSSHWLSEAVGEREFMAVQLTPIGAHLVLRLPMHSIADRIVELDDIDPRFARELVGRVSVARDWAGRFDALESVLAERLADRQVPVLTSRALDRVAGADGNIALAFLAEELGCSHRHLIASFHEHVGLPPKKIARLARLNRALAMIERQVRVDHPDGKPYLERQPPIGASRPYGRSINWADLALSFGYSDQSHFIREFRAFTGWSPSQFQAATHPDFTA